MDIPPPDRLANQETYSRDPAGLEPAIYPRTIKRLPKNAWWITAIILSFLVGLGSGYGLFGRNRFEGASSNAATSEMEMLVEQVNPKDGYTLPVTMGDLGSQMVNAGVIDRDLFNQIYKQAGQPLTEEQMAMLDGTYTEKVVMNRENAYFLLNYFWALGLSSKNPILDTGPIQQNGKTAYDRYASTGGWTLATKPIKNIFSALDLISLTPTQQKRVEDAAAVIYRPCCDNPTHFPDCNHGMAMLGLLELMASQNTSLDEMFIAAKYVNAFWYPQQTLEQAIYFLKAEGSNYKDIDAKSILGPRFSSGTGFNNLHQTLSQNGWLPQSGGSGGSCGV